MDPHTHTAAAAAAAASLRMGKHRPKNCRRCAANETVGPWCKTDCQVGGDSLLRLVGSSWILSSAVSMVAVSQGQDMTVDQSSCGSQT